MTKINIKVFSLIWLVSLLILAGCTKQSQSRDMSALSWKNAIEQLEILIASWADMEKEDKYGDTVLMETIDSIFLHYKQEIVETLLKHGANPNHQNKNGQTPLMYACMNWNVEIVKMLLEHGADIYQTNKRKLPLIFFATMKDDENANLEIIKMLVDKGIDINQQEKDERTTLMTVSARGHLNLWKWLLEHGANVNIKNNEGKTALMFAKENNQDDMIKLLQEYWAKE